MMTGSGVTAMVVVLRCCLVKLCHRLLSMTHAQIPIPAAHARAGIATDRERILNIVKFLFDGPEI